MSEDPVIRQFNAFAAARTPALLRAAFLLTGDQQLAEDLVQSALARTLRAWNRLQRTENAEAYTRKIMYHLQVRSWKRRARQRQVDRLAASRVDLPDNTAGIADQLAVQQALRTLPIRQRAVVVLRFFEDRSVSETAQLLDCSEGTVKSQTAKALQRLRTQIRSRSQFSELSLI